jgi:hypothetical protein
MHYRNVTRRGLDKALDGAGLEKIRFHDLRHTFASLLISQGENVVWVSRQLGHKKTSVTFDTYAHLFARQEHAEQARDRLEAGLRLHARRRSARPRQVTDRVTDSPLPGGSRGPRSDGRSGSTARNRDSGEVGGRPRPDFTRGGSLCSIPGTPTKKGPGDGLFRFRS